MKLCSSCGHTLTSRVPPGDHLPRHVCDQCGTVHYLNPKVIVGCIPEWQDGRVLMCRRDIEPRRGKWTFPAGFMELGETSGEGAARETREESQAAVEMGEVFCIFNVPRIHQVYILHRARLLDLQFGPTPESSEVRLMREDEIPWDEIAFPTVWHGLRNFFADRVAGIQRFHSMDIR